MGLRNLLSRRQPDAGPVTYVPDISEFQPDVHDPVLLQWTQAVIIRAMYGSAHDDAAWYGGQRRALLHQGGAVFVGIYQYLVAGQSAVAQARALLDLTGPLRPGEKLICDLEEGDGNQHGRWLAWASVIGQATGQTPWLYSGLYFSQTHGLAPVDWVAAYQRDEPPGRHVLWQYTDKQQVPGAGACDCSLFHGSAGELAALAYQPRPKPAPAPAPQEPAGWVQAIALLPVLKPGDRDTKEPWMVRRAQGLLGAVGPALAIDGIYGPATEAAARAFQANHGIKPTGVCDAPTWSMLIAGRAL